MSSYYYPTLPLSHGELVSFLFPSPSIFLPPSSSIRLPLSKIFTKVLQLCSGHIWQTFWTRVGHIWDRSTDRPTDQLTDCSLDQSTDWPTDIPTFINLYLRGRSQYTLFYCRLNDRLNWQNKRGFNRGLWTRGDFMEFKVLKKFKVFCKVQESQYESIFFQYPGQKYPTPIIAFNMSYSLAYDRTGIW